MAAMAQAMQHEMEMETPETVEEYMAHEKEHADAFASQIRKGGAALHISQTIEEDEERRRRGRSSRRSRRASLVYSAASHRRERNNVDVQCANGDVLQLYAEKREHSIPNEYIFFRPTRPEGKAQVALLFIVAVQLWVVQAFIPFRLSKVCVHVVGIGFRFIHAASHRHRRRLSVEAGEYLI